LHVKADADAHVGLAADVIEQTEVRHPLNGAETAGLEKILQESEVKPAPVEVWW